MLTWMKKVLTSPADEERQAWWNARLAAMEGVLGKSDGTVYAANSWMHRQGIADVLRFRGYLTGVTYVTSDLIGNPRQVPNRWGQYELMMCTREENEWAPALLSRLAAYTLEATLHPGDTMDLAESRPKDSTVAGLLFMRPDPPADTLRIMNTPANLVLCLGITESEFAACKTFGTGVMGRMFREKNVFPYTHMNRESVT